MTRYLKALGLVIVAAIALTVMATSTGSADGTEEFTASEYPAILHGMHTTASVYTFAGGRKFECSGGTGTGELTGSSETIKVNPKPTECKFGMLPATTTTSCAEGLDHYDTIFKKTVTKCKKGYKHNVKAFSNAEHTTTICDYEVAETEGEISLENLGGTSGIKVTHEVTGVPYTRVSGTLANCGPASGSATFTATTVITAKNEGGEPIGFDIG